MNPIETLKTLAASQSHWSEPGNDFDDVVLSTDFAALAEHVERLESRLAAAEEQAAMYRWLRDNLQWPMRFPGFETEVILSGPTFDAAVQAAMRETPCESP